MKKIDRKLLVLAVIGLLLFVILALLLPFTHTPVYWLAFNAAICFFLLTVVAYIWAIQRGNTLSRLLGWPILKTALMMLAVQCIVTFILMGFAAVLPLRAVMIVEALLLGVTIGTMLAKDIARDAVLTNESEQAPATETIRKLRVLADRLANASNMPEMRDLADALRYCDPVSCAASAEIEGQIGHALHALDLSGDPAELKQNIHTLMQLLEERNSLVRLNKR